MRSGAPRTLLAVAAAVLLIVWQLHEGSRAHALFGDFRAFYCAASAVAHGANPYTASAIYACERAPMPLGLYRASPGVAVPAPLPGYALLALVPIAVLPYLAACVAWLLILIATVFASAKALALLLDRSFDAMLWTLAAGFAIISLPFGELGSVIVAAVLWMAVALRRGAWAWAALAGGVATILPHVALPVLLGAFLFVPPMRSRIAALAAVLVVLDLACSGPAVAISYLREVLPAHAHSEIGSTAQYGMTWILHGLHASDRAAIFGGELSYVIMTLLGLVAARSLMNRRNDAAYAALVPPAFAVLGGTFMHYTQIMVAIPAALLLYRQSAGSARAIFGAAFLLLVVPWAWVLGAPVLLVVYAVVPGMLAAWVLRRSSSSALRVALASTVLTGVLLVAAWHFGPGLDTHVHAVRAHGDLAQSSWEVFVRSQRASTGIVWWIAKAPTWIGLALLALGCAYVLSKKDFEAPVVIEQVPVTP
ncbi:MAG TPA: glycosyltransferase 87 family protein [Candidatus Baltobacteraceae bacterium]|nr:glycosyltransferase 87 family protein [Candidatus Baltobacteraceae bacterium]